jgi:uncharacterized protein (DUF4415 family)
MSANKPDTKSAWRDPDDAPELDDAWFEEADLYKGKHLIRRGRPHSPTPKISTTIRFDADVLDAFRSGGEGWQTRMNDALRQWLTGHQTR